MTVGEYWYEVPLGSTIGSEKGTDSGRETSVCPCATGQRVYGTVPALSQPDLAGRRGAAPEDINIEVNTYYRFYDIFCEMFPPDEAEFPSLRESLTNLCLHMLAQNDIRMGMTREDYHKRLLAKEILDGNFGEIAGNVFRSMSSKEQEILLGGWLNSFRTGSVLPVFLDMVHGLVADSIVYHNNAYPDEILIYTGWKRERNLEQRIRFLIDTFLDIRYPGGNLL